MLRSVIDHYEERCAKLEARIAELEAQLKLAKTPPNSSLPPSSQHPHAKPPSPKKKANASVVDNLAIRNKHGP